MQLKKYETLYILFAIAVSLSGIYLKNNSEAFSPFIYAFSEQTEQYLESYNLADTDTEPCTEETLGIHNSRTARLLACKFLKQKNNTKISTNIIHSNILPSQEGVFYIALTLKKTYIYYSELLATDYIHNSDGKKRN